MSVAAFFLFHFIRIRKSLSLRTSACPVTSMFAAFNTCMMISQPNRAWPVMSGLVKVTTYLTRLEDIPAYAKVRSRFLGNMKPAFMQLVMPQFVWPELLLEVEITAAKAV
jgi:hypothetical protein